MGLCFFKGLCLLFFPNSPGATFIQRATLILESRVSLYSSSNVAMNFLFYLKTLEILKCRIMSIGHNGCCQTVDVVRQLTLSDGQYFQTGDVVRQLILSESRAILVMKFRY